LDPRSSRQAGRESDLFSCPSGSSLAPSLSSIRLYTAPHRSVSWHLPRASSLLHALGAGCSATDAEKSTISSSSGGGGSSSSSSSIDSSSSHRGSGVSLPLPRPSSFPLRSLHAQNAPLSTWPLVGHLFRHLTTLDLSQSKALSPSSQPHGSSAEWEQSEEALCQAIRSLPLLERLALPLASDAILTEISQSCPKLIALHAQPLAQFVAVFDNRPPHFSMHARDNPSRQYCLSSQARTCLRVALPPIQSRVTDAGVVAIANGCTRLEQLSLGGCVNVGPVGLRQLARRCGRLEMLRLARTAVNDAAVVAALFGDTWPGAAAVGAAAVGSSAGAAATVGGAPEVSPAPGPTAGAGSASAATLQLHLPRLLLLDLYGCPGVSPSLLLAFLEAAKELAGDSGECRDGVAEVEKEEDGDYEEKRVVDEGKGHYQGRVELGRNFGLQDFRLRRLLVSPEVIVGDDWRVRKRGGSKSGMGDCGGSERGSVSVDLRLAAREVGMLLPRLVVTARRTAEHVLPWDGFFGERKLEVAGYDGEEREF
ncbi:hypothetical protein CLOM_g23006, partial [Closterium sp. NIES-68]